MHQRYDLGPDDMPGPPALPAPDDDRPDEVQPYFTWIWEPNISVSGAYNFYHEAASAADTNPLWKYAGKFLTTLLWAHDHFVLKPNPRYLVPSTNHYEQTERVRRVILNYYNAKKLIGSMEAT